MVTALGAPVSGAAVNLTITKPIGAVVNTIARPRQTAPQRSSFGSERDRLWGHGRYRQSESKTSTANLIWPKNLLPNRQSRLVRTDPGDIPYIL
jgi:hypothetical protein